MVLLVELILKRLFYLDLFLCFFNLFFCERIGERCVLGRINLVSF